MLSAVRGLLQTSGGEHDVVENEGPGAVFWPVCPQDYHPTSHTGHHGDGGGGASHADGSSRRGDVVVDRGGDVDTASSLNSVDVSYSLDLRIGHEIPALVLRNEDNNNREERVRGGRLVDDDDDAFAYHHNNNLRGNNGPHAAINNEEERVSARRRRLVGIIIIVMSVLVNAFSTIAFLTGSLTPLYSYVNINGTKIWIYMPGAESDAPRGAGPFSGKQRDVVPCLRQVLVIALGGSCGAMFFLVLALVASICVCRWTTGILRFIRPFLFTLATLCGTVSSVFIRTGFQTACDEGYRSSLAQQGLYYIFFGTALTFLHTILLYVQVSRYPIRTTHPPSPPPAQQVVVDENLMIAGADQQQGHHHEQQHQQH